MKKLLLILVIPLLMGAGCTTDKNTDTTEPFAPFSNFEINEQLRKGELECNISISCRDLGFICPGEVDKPACLEKGTLWPAGIEHEYSQCACFDPNKEY
ncbi:hypothetical protein HOB10_01700 [Candidatus Parcubacteria bacterium]|jgi:hypothetical protein|nr:hypothetical protein [Candidatus Parcubacteria bacterium]